VAFRVFFFLLLLLLGNDFCLVAKAILGVNHLGSGSSSSSRHVVLDIRIRIRFRIRILVVGIRVQFVQIVDIDASESFFGTFYGGVVDPRMVFNVIEKGFVVGVDRSKRSAVAVLVLV